MNRSVIYNIVRYVLSIALPLCLLQYPLIALAVAVVALFVNNVADDYSFYFANKEVAKGNNGTMYRMSSPVNGVITKLERNVPLFSHITKCDALTQEQLMEVNELQQLYGDNGKWQHIAIFLTKFSHHIIVNPQDVKSITALFDNGRFVPMVEDGEIVADNKGEYLGNPAIVIRYVDDSFAVLTLDSYVSKYLIGELQAGKVSAILLRGSQCDLYSKFDFIGDKLEYLKPLKVGEVVQVGDALFECENMLEEESTGKATKSDVDEMVSNGFRFVGGHRKLWKENLWKTASTFTRPFILVTLFVCVGLTFISPLFAYVAFSSVYMFCFCRFYRHLMYALMNAVGLRKWMMNSNRIIQKISVLWQKKICK